MRQVILSCPPVEIGRLASMWRDCNDDREFYSPDFLIAAKAEGTQNQFDYLPLLYNDEWEHGGRRLFLPYGERR